MRTFQLREVKRFVREHAVRVVGSRFKSENVCLQRPHCYHFLLTSTDLGVSFDGRKKAELGQFPGKTSLWQRPEFLTTAKGTEGIGKEDPGKWGTEIRRLQDRDRTLMGNPSFSCQCSLGKNSELKTEKLKYMGWKTHLAMATLSEFIGNRSLHRCTWISCCVDLTIIYGYISRVDSKVDR